MIGAAGRGGRLQGTLRAVTISMRLFLVHLVVPGSGTDIHMRKNRKVRRVMGWLLSFQLREPAAGVCCAVSMLGSLVCDGGVCDCAAMGGGLRFTWHLAQERARRRSAFEMGAPEQLPFPARHRLYAVGERPRHCAHI
jgi:hypothetical protein